MRWAVEDKRKAMASIQLIPCAWACAYPQPPSFKLYFRSLQIIFSKAAEYATKRSTIIRNVKTFTLSRKYYPNKAELRFAGRPPLWASTPASGPIHLGASSTVTKKATQFRPNPCLFIQDSFKFTSISFRSHNLLAILRTIEYLHRVAFPS